MAGKRVLIICSSHDKLGATGGKPTGVWAEELAAPYLILKEAGVHVDVVSTKGGKIPIDPKSLQGAQSEHTNRFLTEDEHKSKLESSLAVADISEEYDGVFFPGGHGVCFDCPENPKVIAVLEKFWAQGKIVAAVCHGPVAFVNVKSPSGEYIVKGRKVTGFTNSEEEAVGAVDVVPFLLEDRLKELGALYERGPDWGPCAVADGKLITGQNPQSSAKVAGLILSAL